MQIDDLISKGAIFYISHSGGKDSQAMYITLSKMVPREQMVVVHADLGEVEWEGATDHIRNTISHDLNVVAARKTLLGMVANRAKTRPEVPSWPSSSTRQCTSDLKRGPIYKFIRNDMKSKGALLGVNCTGIRAQESPGRSRKKPFSINPTLSKAGRTVYEWMPIFSLTSDQVFKLISDAGQSPFWAYEKNDRLSCVFCIMGCDNDLRHGMRQRPNLLGKYLHLERETGYTMFNGKSLADRCGIIATDFQDPITANLS